MLFNDGCFFIYNFDKEDYWKQDYQERKNKRGDSYDEIKEDFATNLPKELHMRSCEDEYIKQFECEKLYEAIDSLPETQKRRIILRFFNNLTLREIAEIDDVSTQAVKVALNKAKLQIKKYVERFF